jgi:hypothetical protein
LAIDRDLKVKSEPGYTCYALRFKVPSGYPDWMFRLNVFKWESRGHWRASINGEYLATEFKTKEAAARALTKKLREMGRAINAIKSTDLVPRS